MDKAELAVIPNADHFTMAGQFDIVAMVLQNFMQRVIGPNQPEGTQASGDSLDDSLDQFMTDGITQKAALLPAGQWCLQSLPG